MVSCLMGDSTALASAIVRCCLNSTRKVTICLLSFIPICAESGAVGMVIIIDRLTHPKKFFKLFFKNFPVCTPEMCSGYVRRRKRTSSNLQKGGMRHDVSL